MNSRIKPACVVCGDTGYWVGYSPHFDEVRCINHLHPETTPMVLDDELPSPDRGLPRWEIEVVDD